MGAGAYVTLALMSFFSRQNARVARRHKAIPPSALPAVRLARRDASPAVPPCPPSRLARRPALPAVPPCPPSAPPAVRPAQSPPPVTLGRGA